VGSEYVDGIEVIGCDPVKVPNFMAYESELAAFQLYKDRIRDFNAIHDFSNMHIPSLFTEDLPILNVVWHNPVNAYPRIFREPSYNIVAISEFGAEMFRKVYNQEARYLETVCMDLSFYKPDPLATVLGRHITLGAMNPVKGHHDAIRLCRKAGVPLLVGGFLGLVDHPSYHNTVKRMCGGSITWVGEVSEEKKISLLQRSCSMIFACGQPEVHSGKVYNALACGCPVVTWNRGAMKEVVGDAGYVVDTEDAFIEAIHNVEYFDRSLCVRRAQRWDVIKVVDSIIPVYESIADGERW